ncbi:MAG: hypothetical protein RIE58_06080 [Vicingaceae bacterium]
MKLGRLQKVELREQWKKEDTDFTPWLAKEENIELLSETIGIELEVQGQEENVGPFRADILCLDTANNHYVLIENQLEKTDHTLRAINDLCRWIRCSKHRLDCSTIY